MQAFLKLTFIAFFIFLSALLRAQESVQNFAKNPDLKGASVSVVISDIQTGELLQSANPDERLCPASVWKLFTTSAAIKILGADFRFHTTLATQGKIENGVLDGNLFILGGGDPALGSRFFDPGFDGLLDEWVAAVRAAGIDSITGKVVGNAAHFTGAGLPRTRIWEDMANYYGSAVSGLNINDNTYFVDFNVPAELGQKAKIRSVYPKVPGLQISSEVLSSSIVADRAYIFGSPLDNIRIVRGTLPANRDHYTIKGSLPKPPLFAAWHLRKHLEASGVGVGNGIAVELKSVHERGTMQVVHTHKSPALAELVAHTNIKSDNLFAETMLFQLGARRGEPNINGGLEALKDFYSEICNRSYPFYAYDGSGLSRFGAVSTRQISSLLTFAAGDDLLRKHILEKLPQAGREGSMRWFGRRSNLEGNVRGKSGSMEKVKAFAGVLNAHSGRQLGFAVIVNNFDGEPNHVTNLIENMLLEVYGDY